MIDQLGHESWGRFPKVKQRPVHLARRGDRLPLTTRESYLPFGRGRSYGDCCLNEGGIVVVTRALDNFISFDPTSGRLTCEGGVTLAEILRVMVPRGFFLPVTPGTKFVTVGGAIANDVHGKNHHRVGTFGCFVDELWLRRSDGSERHCSLEREPALFRATIGGCGLTGLITAATIRLRPISSPAIVVTETQFTSLEEFFDISRAAVRKHEYTVAWLDCLSDSVRGIMMAGDHAPVGTPVPKAVSEERVAVPIDFPEFALNGWSVRAFNELYYRKQRAKVRHRVVHYEPFFYPLDAVHGWNKIYGRRGFLQFQCVMPHESSHDRLREILRTIARSQQASFLAVMKEFGEVRSPGTLSFPRPGVTLCLDIPYRGERTERLFTELHAQVAAAGGALYTAKDALMDASQFQHDYPGWRLVAELKDPRASSSLWRRVIGKE